MTVYMSLLPVIPSTAKVYCAALRKKPTAFITATNLIKAADNVAFIPSYSTNSEVMITELAALTDYYVYCYVENVFGVGNSLSTVVSTKSPTTTTCCHRVSITTAPSPIYLSAAKYSSSKMRGKNIFTYSLNGPPTSVMTVTCVVMNATSGELLGSNYKCLPASKTYTSTSSGISLTGRFFLSGPSTVSLTVAASLELSGASAGDFYDVRSVSVIVLPANVLPPAPKLISATFASSGLYISVTFDSDTNMPSGSTTEIWNCNYLFTLYSNAYSCSWQSASKLLIEFPTVQNAADWDEYISVDSRFSLRSSLLTAYCDDTNLSDDDGGYADDSLSCSNYPASSTATFVVRPPARPMTPTIVLNIPSEHCVCDDLIIDLSGSFGSAGRPWVFGFVVLTKDGSSFIADDASSMLEGLWNASLLSNGSFVIRSDDLSVDLIGTYSVQLMLTNFLGGTSTTTTYLSLHDDVNKPTIQVPSGSSVTITSSAALSIEGTATLPSCAEYTTYLQYFWNVTDSNGDSVNDEVVSVSADPRRFLLAPFTLAGGYPYTVTFVVYSFNGSLSESDADVLVPLSSSEFVISVFVMTPSVDLIISGGYELSPPVDTALILDTSASLVLSGEGAPMDYNVTWTCVHDSLDENYGVDCGITDSDGDDYKAASLTIEAGTLQYGLIYRVGAVLVAEDGSVSSKTVLITPAAAGTAVLDMLSTFNDASCATKFTLFAAVLSTTTDTLCTWSVSFTGDVVNASTALTPTVILVTSAEVSAVSGGLHLPFAAPPNFFVARRSYLFTLTACSLESPSSCSSTETTVHMHSAPAGGFTDVDPPEGTAAVDVFKLSSSQWLADAECYPFKYSFACRLSATHPPVALSFQSGSAMTFATLPPGLSAFNYSVVLEGTVMDIFEASASAVTEATVFVDNGVDVSILLEETLSSFERTADYSALFQAFGSTSSILNLKNCSAAPACGLLNRIDCYEVSNTCGSCLVGFTGIIGPDNSPCQNIDAVKGVGSACSSSSECLYDTCEAGICNVPLKGCPSDCSNNGVCTFLDPSGALFANCTVKDVFCQPVCECDVGFFGDDCSMNYTQFRGVEGSRILMCKGLLLSASTQDPSPQLVNTLVSSLATIYVPTEISTYDGHVACLDVLNLIADMSHEGYLRGTQKETLANLMEIVSLFSSVSSKLWPVEYVVLDNSTDSSAVNNTNVTTAFSISYVSLDVTAITDSVLHGISKTLVAGESPVTIATDNVRVAVSNARLASLQNSSLSPPSTLGDEAYGVSQPVLQLPGDGLGTACGTGGSGYMQLSMKQWGKNPHANSSQIKSPLFDISTQNPAGSSGRRSLTAPNASALISDSAAYFVTLQFTARLTLNFSDYYSAFSNRTIPACQYYDGLEYIVCAGCNISTFTEYNVTYACYDIGVLCSDSSNRRSLSRRLASDDDMSVDGSGGSFASYGMILGALGAEIGNVLSINPFAINFNKAKAVIIFVGILLFVMVGGIAYFTKWDASDHNKLAYLRAERLEAKRARHEAQELKRLALKKGLTGEADPLTTAQEKDFLGLYKSKSQSQSMDQAVEAAFQVHTSSWGEYIATFICCKCLNMDTPLGLEDDDEDRHGHDGALTDEDEGDTASVRSLEKMDDDMKAEMATMKINKQTAQGLIVLKNFVDEAMPPRALLAKGDILRRFISALATYHPYVCMLSHPSCMTTRTMRWLSVTRGILISLFIDTLFFGIFYPDDMTCPTFTTEAACLAQPSKISAGQSMCTWDEPTESCSLAPPPGTLVYTMSISLLCVVINIPLDLVFGYLMDEFATRRPNLESLGLNSESWLGTGSSNNIATESEKHAKEARDRVAVHYNSKLRDVLVVDKLATDVSARMGDSTTYDKVKNARVQDNLYYDYATPEEEVAYILNETKKFWMDEFDNTLSIKAGDSAELTASMQDAKARALMEVLKVYPNGSPMPLSFIQTIIYGSAHNKLYCSISGVRKHAQVLGEELQEMIKIGIAQSVNVFLVQHFVMEQVSSLTRFALQRQLFNYKELAPFAIDFWPWFASWIAISAMFVFFFYWIFSWGVVNGGTTLAHWGINFVIGTVQDFFVVQPGKIFILFIVSVEAAKPQMRSIQKRLLHVMMTMLHQDETVLRRNHDLSIVQHTSVACRAARMRLVYEFPSAYILREMSDLDVQCCRDRKGVGFGTVLFIIVGIPALIGLVSELGIDNLMEVVVPSVFTGFIIVNNVLLAVSPVVLAIPYIILASFLLYQFGILGPSLKRVRLMNRRKVYRLQGSNWRESKRSASRTRTDLSNSGHASNTAGISPAQPASFVASLLGRFGNRCAALIVYASKPFFPKSVSKAKHATGGSKLAKSAPRLNWQRMNNPTFRQGKIASKADENNIDAQESAMNTAIETAETHIVQNRTVHEIPEAILMMIPDSVFARAKNDSYTAALLDHRVFDADTRFEDITAWKQSITSSQYMIHEPKDWNDRSELAGRVGADIKTSNVEVALQAMYEYIIFNSRENVDGADTDSKYQNLWTIRKLFANSKRKLEAFQKSRLENNSSGAGRESDAKIMQDLQREQQHQRRIQNRAFLLKKYENVLPYVWSIFYPGGIPLSRHELEEARLEFYAWSLKHLDSESTSTSTNCSLVVIPFNIFETWFITYVDEIIRFREWTAAVREPMLPIDMDVWFYAVETVQENENTVSVAAAEDTSSVNTVDMDSINIVPQQKPVSYFTIDWGVTGT
jgi:hypothetical protein